MLSLMALRRIAAGVPMERFFYASSVRYDVVLQPIGQAAAGAPRGEARKTRKGLGATVMASRNGKPAGGGEAVEPGSLDHERLVRTVRSSPVLSSRVHEPSRLAIVTAVARKPSGTRAAPPVEAPRPTFGIVTLATETVIAEGLRQADVDAAKKFGARIIEEGREGKTLFRVDSVEQAFELVKLLQSREVGAVAPNFLRRIVRPNLSTAAPSWAHLKIDVATAWSITRGRADIRVAVLDEGVDTIHHALKSAVVAEKDFIGSNGNSAMPSGDDAHGTACAGIIVSRDKQISGIAPQCSLVAARIAMGDGSDGWVFDDFATADAIDWCWRDEHADVLSNSWGGGVPSDAISRAFARARTQGRNDHGAVVVIAAGNAQQPIDFPGNLPGYVTVGASTPRDERKTKSSSDGEYWWGSNYGETLSLLAPGVRIATTDISGPAGYDSGDFTQTFNGTSSATPHIAAVAALMLSANPTLSAPTVRSILGQTAKRIEGQAGWTRELGFGRLDAGRAVETAAAAGKPQKHPPHRKKKTRKRATGAKEMRK